LNDALASLQLKESSFFYQPLKKDLLLLFFLEVYPQTLEADTDTHSLLIPRPTQQQSNAEVPDAQGIWRPVTYENE